MVDERRNPMKVTDVMMGTPYSCARKDNLGMAAELMWKGNCGFLPVLDESGTVCGVLTDRDICIALCTRNVRASELQVQEVEHEQVFVCHTDDDIHVALQVMRENHVRRLPVLDDKGKLAGVISVDDIVTHAEPNRMGKQPELSADETVRTYRKILQRDLPATKKAVA
jgi:CBS domain-containing protein